MCVATGFKIAGGADLDTILMPGSGGSVTGLKVAGGADLSSVFMPYTTGAQVASTGFKLAGGADLATRFQNISVPIVSVVNPTPSGAAERIVPLANAGCSIIVNANGSITGSGFSPVGWLNPWGTAGMGNAYHVYFEYVSGDAVSNTGSWIPISGNPFASITAILPSIKQSTIRIYISADGGASWAANPGTWTMYAESTLT